MSYRAHTRARRFMLAFPTNDGLTSCCTAGRSRNSTPCADVDPAVHALLGEVDADLAERTRSGCREERYVGTADVPGYFRRPFGPGWALVGDAGYHRDPCSGWGIADAFRDAESGGGSPTAPRAHNHDVVSLQLRSLSSPPHPWNQLTHLTSPHTQKHSPVVIGAT